MKTLKVVEVDGTGWIYSPKWKKVRREKPATYASSPPASAASAAAVAAAEPPSHDRSKLGGAQMLPPSLPYLRALGLVDASGAARPNRKAKLAQCRRFVEVLDAAFRELPHARAPGEKAGGYGAEAGPGYVDVVDMGAGMGYLTFSVYQRLTSLGVRVRCVGVEGRRAVCDAANARAAEVGFDNLRFVQGTIGGYVHEGEGIDVLMALHACDTATDDAIRAAVEGGASLVVLAPCCHKEVRRLCEGGGAKGRRGVLRHGIHRGRMCETATDAIRALVLEVREGEEDNRAPFLSFYYSFADDGTIRSLSPLSSLSSLSSLSPLSFSLSLSTPPPCARRGWGTTLTCLSSSAGSTQTRT